MLPWAPVSGKRSHQLISQLYTGICTPAAKCAEDVEGPGHQTKLLTEQNHSKIPRVEVARAIWTITSHYPAEDASRERSSCAPGEEDGQVHVRGGLVYELGQPKHMPMSCRHPAKHFYATALSAQCLKFVSVAFCHSSGTNSSGASLHCQLGFIYFFEMQIF